MAKWGSADFEELKALANELLEMKKEIDEFCEIAAKALAHRLLSLVIRDTPVGVYPTTSGKTGGTLKRGWLAETHEGAAGGSGSPTAAQALEYAKSLPIEKSGHHYIIRVINPVKYASYVEFGHRTVNGGFVKGQYFLTKAEAILENEKDRILEKDLTKYLKDHIS